MRTKRQQRRRRRLLALSSTPVPDPFSRWNDELVHAEELLMGICPCCEDRIEEMRQSLEAEFYEAEGR